MNSFRFLKQGINAEIARQIALLEAGEEVVQETLHFDPRIGRLSPLRSKEEAHDYRYFPEPDLVPLVPTEAMLEAARAALPELPAERAERYERDWGLPEDTARLLAFEPALGDYFEDAATAAARASSARRRQLGDRRAARAARGRGRPGRLEGRAAGARRARRARAAPGR